MTHHQTIDELQRHGLAGDEAAILELGRRALNLTFDCGTYCEHREELWDLEDALLTEIPPDCPHCGKLLTDI